MYKSYNTKIYTNVYDKALDSVKQILIDKAIINEDATLQDIVSVFNTHTFFKEIIDATGHISFGESLIPDVSEILTVDDMVNLKSLKNSFSSSTLTKLPFPLGYKFTIKDISHMAHTSGITSLEEYDYTKVEDINYAFAYCSYLTRATFKNTMNIKNYKNLFLGCSRLEYVSGIDLINAESTQSIFSGCYNLTHVYVYNIKNNIVLGSSSSTFGTLITKDSYLHLCSECINTGSEHILYVHNNVIPMLDSIYVKFVDATQTDIPVDTKGSIVECSETDEGAFLLPEYLALKQWSYRKY